jgi:hypothetical protein
MHALLNLYKGKICYMTPLLSSVCQNTPSDYVFARYLYNRVAHLQEHIARPKRDSLTLLPGMTMI